MTKKQRRAAYVDRGLVYCNHHICLCTSKEQFYAEIKALKIPLEKAPALWCKPRGACVCFLVGAEGGNVAVVSIDPGPEGNRSSPTQVAAMLCHEAVHIFQEDCRDRGEKNPSDEYQAYAIQAISQNLMDAYVAQLAQ